MLWFYSYCFIIAWKELKRIIKQCNVEYTAGLQHNHSAQYLQRTDGHWLLAWMGTWLGWMFHGEMNRLCLLSVFSLLSLSIPPAILSLIIFSPLLFTLCLEQNADSCQKFWNFEKPCAKKPPHVMMLSDKSSQSSWTPKSPNVHLTTSDRKLIIHIIFSYLDMDP